MPTIVALPTRSDDVARLGFATFMQWDEMIGGEALRMIVFERG